MAKDASHSLAHTHMHAHLPHTYKHAHLARTPVTRTPHVHAYLTHPCVLQVVINVGGSRFETRWSTLHRSPVSRLSTLNTQSPHYRYESLESSSKSQDHDRHTENKFLPAPTHSDPLYIVPLTRCWTHPLWREVCETFTWRYPVVDWAWPKKK